MSSSTPSHFLPHSLKDGKNAEYVISGWKNVEPASTAARASPYYAEGEVESAQHVLHASLEPWLKKHPHRRVTFKGVGVLGPVKALGVQTSSNPVFVATVTGADSRESLVQSLTSDYIEKIQNLDSRFTDWNVSVAQEAFSLVLGEGQTKFASTAILVATRSRSSKRRMSLVRKSPQSQYWVLLSTGEEHASDVSTRSATSPTQGHRRNASYPQVTTPKVNDHKRANTSLFDLGCFPRARGRQSYTNKVFRMRLER